MAGSRGAWQAKVASFLVFEGWDGSGPGTTACTLWRFWRRLLPPQEKQILIFDRSWYGRVLVERVEGFAAREAWQRAYREINDFERQLHETGILLGKFWFHVSREEQLRRFEARELTPHETWKLTDEDWRNRDKWGDYENAVRDMLLKTSTIYAPWTVVEGEDKRWARIRVLRTVVEVIAAERAAASSDLKDKKKKKKGKKRRA
ncbi:MAG: hypothetical protein V3T72_08660 [Thermoanaerobaculia bacterium]